MHRTLAHYEVYEQLGAGGMGEVYRAHDTRLERDVALKLLPRGTFADEAARARLLREARLASALNHPHIATIYEVGEAENQIYIGMEHVKGKSLSELIPTGGLPTETVLRYGAQIADALSHAHEHGIVHRDLKGSNVVITPDGRAKVLDFGLARRVAAPGGEETLEIQRALTETGAVVGTPEYLAPEVLRGGTADAPSDLWALGVLLHEMATGSLPFQGKTAFELSAAILSDPPSPLPARLPAGLRAVIQRCLAKEPPHRFRQASEVRAALETLQSDIRAPIEPGPSRPRMIAWRAAALAALAASIAVAVWLAGRHPVQPRDLKQRQLTTSTTTNPLGAVLSPDGKYLVVPDGEGLSLRSIETGDARSLSLPDGLALGLMPCIDWFPDGSQLVVSGEEPDGSPCIWEIPVLAGRPRQLGLEGRLGRISPDASRIAYVKMAKTGPEIWCARSNGEEPRRIASSDSTGTFSTWPVWSPEGRRLAYERVSIGPRGPRIRLESSDLEGRARIFYSDTPEQSLHYYTTLVWLPDGRVVFGLSDPPPSQEVNLWALHVDPKDGAPAGKPSRITQWVGASLLVPTGASSDGRRLSVTLVQYRSDVYVGRIAEADSMLQDVHRLTLDDRMDMSPAWMPGGTAVLFASDRNGTPDVFRQALDRTTADPVVTGAGYQGDPSISPDGAWILYKQMDTEGILSSIGPASLMRTPIGGGRSTKVLDMKSVGSFRCGSPRAALCVLCETDGTELRFSAFDPVHGRGAELIRCQASVFASWDLSPDGSAVAIADPQDSLPRLQVVALRGGGGREVPLDRKINIVDLEWAADGRGWFVVYTEGGIKWGILRVEPSGRTTQLLPTQMWMYSCAPSPDGRRLAYTSNIGIGNTWLLEDF